MEIFWLLAGFGVFLMCAFFGIAAITWAEAKKAEIKKGGEG